MDQFSVHLVDGTYELFRAYYGAPKARVFDKEVGAIRGLLRTLFALVQSGATHVACAFDNPIESFRNDLFNGYKTSAGVEPELLAQFDLAEEAAKALGFVVWKMVEFEADDALATAAARYATDPNVAQVVICSPDKDLTQCVRETKVVCLDRMRNRIYDEAAVCAKFGIAPASIPDYLALVGDDADGIPGVPRWGAKSAAAILHRYGRLEEIPEHAHAWDVKIRGALALASSLSGFKEPSLLYRRLATLRLDVPLAETAQDLRWQGANRDALGALCSAVADETFPGRITLFRCC